MRRFFSILALLILSLALALATAWAALALWYRLPLPEFARMAVAGAFGLLGIAAIVRLRRRRYQRVLGLYIVALLAVIAWWSTIEPSADGDWAPDVSRQVTGVLNGDILTLTNVRDFDWRSDSDFTERWATRSYDLSKLKSLDMFMSYWAGPKMAHVIMSFGFEGGEYLAWSIEVRRSKGGAFSPLADFFKSNPLVIVAADERDVVGVRSNVRGEDVQIYRLRTPPAAARKLLLEYVSDANALSEKPEFYNSITTNCTTTIVKMMRAVGATVPLDYRLIVNGYLPDYAHDQGALDPDLKMQQLRDASHIAERAKADGLSENFSQAIRAGVPSPAAQ